MAMLEIEGLSWGALTASSGEERVEVRSPHDDAGGGSAPAASMQTSISRLPSRAWYSTEALGHA